MNFLRRFFSSWPNIVAAIVAILVFLLSPIFVRWYDPTAGVFDAGYLQAVLLASVYSFSAGSVGWAMWQLFFPTLDKDTATKDSEWGSLRDWFWKMTDAQRWFAVQGTFVFCIVVYLLCLILALK